MAVVAAHLDSVPRATGRTIPWKLVIWWMVGVIAAAGWVLYLRPSTVGGPAGYVIVSGSSMEPLMRTGDLALVHRRPSYGIGDVVAYRIPKDHVGGGMLVIHRVIGGNGGDGYVLQGDNREHPDMWRPRHADVIGNLVVHVPHLGTALFLLRTPLVLATAMGLFGFWFIVVRDDEERTASAESEPDEGPPVAELDHIAHPEIVIAVDAPAPVAAPAHRSLLVAVGVGAAIGLVCAVVTSRD